jgi:hypothetical protein
MMLGTVTHRVIEQFMLFKWTQHFLDGHPASGWTVLFADSGDGSEEVYLASDLKIEGISLRCVPDLVMVNKETDTVLIVERKTTHVPEPLLPENGWPNVEAQLWCYSYIDDWEDAREVLLIGQLWHRFRGGVQLCHSHPTWKRSDKTHDDRCRYWFERYGGQVGR